MQPHDSPADLQLRPFSADTDPQMHAMIVERLRAMTPTERLQMVGKLNRACEAHRTP
jgi:hypothetical protein